MSSEGFLKEMQTIGEKFLLKLQKLPKADPVEIVSFCVVLLFIGEFTVSFLCPIQWKPVCFR
uniref:Small integral membrane protein 5 n=3 Tax=Strigidae TaxID=30459 RepID=A0A8C0I8L6_BUBBB